ncbi:MAG: TMEM175 family protein [Jiangellales bacterium]
MPDRDPDSLGAADSLPQAPERGPDRVIAFSDGVVAIAITLLLLPLADLTLPANGNVTTLIAENSALLFGLGVTWVVIALFWSAHHRLFERITAIDNGVLWLNFGWLLAIAVLPLPTNLNIANAPSPQVTGFYLGWMTLISLFLAAIRWRVSHQPGLLEESYRASRESRTAGIRTLLILAVFALSFGVALIAPDRATTVLLLLFFVDLLAARIARP